jgi:hypothetical protein
MKKTFFTFLFISFSAYHFASASLEEQDSKPPQPLPTPPSQKTSRPLPNIPAKENSLEVKTQKISARRKRLPSRVLKPIGYKPNNAPIRYKIVTGEDSETHKNAKE